MILCTTINHLQWLAWTVSTSPPLTVRREGGTYHTHHTHYTTLTISFSVLDDFLLRTTGSSSEGSPSKSVVSIVGGGGGCTGGVGAGGGGARTTGAWEQNTVNCCDCVVVHYSGNLLAVPTHTMSRRDIK